MRAGIEGPRPKTSSATAASADTIWAGSPASPASSSTWSVPFSTRTPASARSQSAPASPARRSIASKLIRRTVQQRDEIDPWSRKRPMTRHEDDHAIHGVATVADDPSPFQIASFRFAFLYSRAVLTAIRIAALNGFICRSVRAVWSRETRVLDYSDERVRWIPRRFLPVLL
jgi:hypothetical protein